MQEYSFLNQLLLVNGIPIGGYDEGDDVIQVVRNVEPFGHKVGAYGNMVVYQNADKSGTITFRLQQGAASNALLQHLVDLQEANQGTFAPVQVVLKNIIDQSIVIGSNGYVTKPSDITRGTGVNAQEWVLVVEDLNTSGAHGLVGAAVSAQLTATATPTPGPVTL